MPSEEFCHIKNLILEELIAHGKTYISGEELAKKMNVSRTVIWTCIKELQSDGFLISSSTRKGYRLENTGDLFSSILIREKVGAFWGKIITGVSFENTIDTARNMLKDRNIAVITGKQLSGRGRRGRPFSSPKGGLYMSIAFHPVISLESLQLITAYTAVIVGNAIETVTGLKTQIKWVNDLYLDNKKLCGILTESVISVENKDLNTLVIGIGININKLPEDFPFKDTSVALCDFVEDVDRNLLAAEILNNFEKGFNTIEDKSFIKAYRERSCVIGKTVTVLRPDREFTAKAIDIDDNAALIIEHKGGKRELLNSGEISLRL
jgi:BirA family biotin operon repressor/biotin-[acetyl-CoA-carboxylase] ligase